MNQDLNATIPSTGKSIAAATTRGPAVSQPDVFAVAASGGVRDVPSVEGRIS
ncbi:MAG: hypothetical protein IT175_11345 [Acidobacteria bacterium]|nr:hypothetical protein [Acidobacteriota bacterium]